MPKVFTSETQKTGEIGENIAVKFLVKHSFTILERNYTKKWGELDIVAEKDAKLYFVEVKSVSHMPVSYETDKYNPEDNLHPWKLKRLSRVIQTYLLNYKGNKEVSYETGWQFDVAVVYLDLKTM